MWLQLGRAAPMAGALYSDCTVVPPPACHAHACRHPGRHLLSLVSAVTCANLVHYLVHTASITAPGSCLLLLLQLLQDAGKTVPRVAVGAAAGGAAREGGVIGMPHPRSTGGMPSLGRFWQQLSLLTGFYVQRKLRRRLELALELLGPVLFM